MNLLNFKKNPWDKYYPKGKTSVKVPNMSLYEYIYSNNKNRMDNIAIEYFQKKTTYKELFNKIDLCARAMRSQGIRPGDVVSICMANTPEAVISFYAVSKIGAIANMIHPLSAEEEIRKSLSDTNSVMLITINLSFERIKNIIHRTNVYKTIIVSAKDSMPALTKISYYLLYDRKISTPKSNEMFINWNDFLNKGNNYKSEVTIKTTKNQPAVILHSGGTTGVPKNILLSNGNINVVPEQAKISLYDVDDSDRMLSILPLFHCFGLVESLHFPLATGQCVILIPKFDASKFDRILIKNKPTIIPGVPTLFEAMIENKKMQNIDLSNVKYIVSGGDTLPSEKQNRINQFLKGHNCKHNIVQGYGLTETSGGCVFPTKGTDLPGASGIALPGTMVKIINMDTFEECQPNEPGEILISGPAVMIGYLNNEEETNKVLEKDKKGRIWVHTGDMGYLNEDGILFFVQRIKRLIIVSGYNVFPSHIEDVLNKHPKILNSCVIGIPHPYKVQVPKAFIVLKSGVKESPFIRKEIKDYCAKNLSNYMIPKEFVYRESLPKTMIGKVDYRKLEEKEKDK